tara:strand:+ start:293 stop:1033 length:741 start_codon:yes stop_codon:yes gene_type:complete
MRPLIKHISASRLVWEEILSTGAMRKVYSIDPDTGSDTSFVKLPAGWQGPAGAHYHSDYEEALVLDGDVDLNGDDLLVSGSYLYRPGGIVHGWVDKSTGGSEIIIKMGMETDLVSVGRPLFSEEYDYPGKRVVDGRPHISHLKTLELTWSSYSNIFNNIGKKVLSTNSDNGSQTYLIKIPVGFVGDFRLDSNHTHEWIVLEGSMVLADGSVFELMDYSHRPKQTVVTNIVTSLAGAKVLIWSNPTS